MTTRFPVMRMVTIMFREDKSTQMAALFLKMAGRTMPYIHLIKMMYIADKEMTLAWGLPITFDNWVAMPLGPVLSNTYDLIKAGSGQPTYWSRHIQKKSKNVILLCDPGSDDLSDAEEDIITETFKKFGAMNRWDVVELTHTFPEWADPDGSSFPISLDRMLDANSQPNDKALVADLVATQDALQTLGGSA